MLKNCFRFSQKNRCLLSKNGHFQNPSKTISRAFIGYEFSSANGIMKKSKIKNQKALNITRTSFRHVYYAKL